jgi:hypothetical protein
MTDVALTRKITLPLTLNTLYGLKWTFYIKLNFYNLVVFVTKFDNCIINDIS